MCAPSVKDFYRNFLFATGICLLLLLFSPNSKAGTIRGKVSDSTNAPVIGATIYVEKTKYGAITNVNGEYKIDNLPEGSYILKAHFIGYRDRRKSEVKVSGGSDEQTVNFTLSLEPLKSADIVVEARASKETDASARLAEKNADNIINVVSAETIEESPYLTSADVLGHVSGISLEKDQGEGRYAIIRGMDQRYNNTTLDGIKIPSPESKTRFVPLDIFPSELLEKIEVTKDLTPDQEADAIGGSANLVFRDAPQDMLLMASAAGGYSSYLFNNQFASFDKSAVSEDPAQKYGSTYQAQSGDFSRDNLKFTSAKALPDGFGSVTIGDRFLDNSLGIIASGSLQNTFRRTEGTLYDLKYDINNVDSTSHIIQPSYADVNDRNYSTNRERTGLYGKLDYILNPLNTFDLSYSYVGLNESEVRYTTNSVIGPGRGRSAYEYYSRSSQQSQNVSTAQLEGNHTLLPELVMKWSASYSDASQDQPDKAELLLDQNKDANGNLDPVIAFHDVTRVWQNNDDRDLQGKLDLEYKEDDDLTFKFGGLYRAKSRKNYENDYVLNPDTTGGINGQVWTNIDSVHWKVYDNYGTSVYGFNNYTATEDITAAYVEGVYTIGGVQFLGGVRMEITQQGYTTMAPQTLLGNSATINYMDFLPSLHVRYAVTPDQNFRFSITQSISRPSYFELVPYQIQGDVYTEEGNYQLRRTKATNLDLRYEIYPSILENITVGVFYKNIVDPIELGFDNSNPASGVIKPQNLGTAVNYGAEAVVSKRFGELGIAANYTYTHSALTSNKIQYQRFGTNDPVTINYQQTRPLVGQSGDILNIVLSLDHSPTGTYLELSYGFTGKRLVLVSPFDGFDNYQDPTSELDASFEQKISDKFTLYGKFSNLLNTPYRVVLPDGMLVQQEYYKPDGQIGVRYKF